MDDSKLRYFASAWLISITLPADSAERYNAQFVNGIDPLAFNQFVASDGDVMPAPMTLIFTLTICWWTVAPFASQRIAHTAGWPPA